MRKSRVILLAILMMGTFLSPLFAPPPDSTFLLGVMYQLIPYPNVITCYNGADIFDGIKEDVSYLYKATRNNSGPFIVNDSLGNGNPYLKVKSGTSVKYDLYWDSDTSGGIGPATNVTAGSDSVESSDTAGYFTNISHTYFHDSPKKTYKVCLYASYWKLVGDDDLIFPDFQYKTEAVAEKVMTVGNYEVKTPRNFYFAVEATGYPLTPDTDGYPKISVSEDTDITFVASFPFVDAYTGNWPYPVSVNELPKDPNKDFGLNSDFGNGIAPGSVEYRWVVLRPIHDIANIVGGGETPTQRESSTPWTTISGNGTTISPFTYKFRTPFEAPKGYTGKEYLTPTPLTRFNTLYKVALQVRSKGFFWKPEAADPYAPPTKSYMGGIKTIIYKYDTESNSMGFLTGSPSPSGLVLVKNPVSSAPLVGSLNKFYIPFIPTTANTNSLNLENPVWTYTYPGQSMPAGKDAEITKDSLSLKIGATYVKVNVLDTTDALAVLESGPTEGTTGDPLQNATLTVRVTDNNPNAIFLDARLLHDVFYRDTKTCSVMAQHTFGTDEKFSSTDKNVLASETSNYYYVADPAAPNGALDGYDQSCQAVYTFLWGKSALSERGKPYYQEMPSGYADSLENYQTVDLRINQPHPLYYVGVAKINDGNNAQHVQVLGGVNNPIIGNKDVYFIDTASKTVAIKDNDAPAASFSFRLDPEVTLGVTGIGYDALDSGGNYPQGLALTNFPDNKGLTSYDTTQYGKITKDFRGTVTTNQPDPYKLDDGQAIVFPSDNNNPIFYVGQRIPVYWSTFDNVNGDLGYINTKVTKETNKKLFEFKYTVDGTDYEVDTSSRYVFIEKRPTTDPINCTFTFRDIRGNERIIKFSAFVRELGFNPRVLETTLQDSRKK